MHWWRSTKSAGRELCAEDMKRRFFFLILIIALAAYLLISVHISYNHLVVRSYKIEAEQVEQPVKIALLGDLHDNEIGQSNCRVLEAVQQMDPDAILVVGDMLNDVSPSSDVAVNLVEQLCQVAPVYYALGNHEVAYMERQGAKIAKGNLQAVDLKQGDLQAVDLKQTDLLEELQAAGTVVLDLESCDVELNGQRIRIGGLYDYAFALDGYDSCDPDKMKPEVYEFLTNFQDTEDFTLMMAHRPESFVLGEASVTWDIDLVVSGHAHGGQVVLPILGGLWAPEQGWLPEYVSGYCVKDKLQFVFTNGLGSDRQLVPRLNNPSEVVEIVLE